jgi:hypothetical protein
MDTSLGPITRMFVTFFSKTQGPVPETPSTPTHLHASEAVGRMLLQLRSPANPAQGNYLLLGQGRAAPCTQSLR